MNNHRNKSAIIFFLFLCVTTSAILYLIFTRIDFWETIAVVQHVDAGLLLATILLSLFLNVFIFTRIRQKIWQYMNHPLKFEEVLFIRMGSLPFKVIPSVKDTDIVASLYMKKFHQMPITEGILSNLIANVCNAIAILGFFVIGYLLYGTRNDDILKYHQYLTAILILGLIVIFFLYSFLLNQKIGKRILFHLSFGKEPKFIELLKKNMDMWKGLPASKNMLLILYTMLFQLSELIIYYFLSKSYHLNIPFAAILLYAPLAIILSQLPITISGFGVREGAYVLFFLNFGTKETLLALGVLTFFVNHIVPLFIAILFLFPFIHKMQLFGNNQAKRWHNAI